LGANAKVIELTNVRNGAILSNNITFNLIGVDLLSCGSSVIENNALQRPDIAYESGVHAIRLYGSDYVEISRNFIKGRRYIEGGNSIGGILLNLSTDCTVDGNSINSFKGRGVYLENSGYCNVRNNWVDDCLLGFYIRASNDCYIEDNIATRTHMGFGVWVGINHIINGNRADKNLGEGYTIANSYDCELVGNIVRDVSDSHYGIELIYGAADNILYGNFILCNNVLDNGTNNDWDDGVDNGNYWTSYNDTGPYPIPGSAGSVDRFPQQFIVPAIDLISNSEFEFGFDNRIQEWTYSGQPPTNYTLERMNEFQIYEIEGEGIWNEFQTTLSLFLEPTEVGEYHYRFTAIYECGFSLTKETTVYIVPASGPHIQYILISESPTPMLDIEVRAYVNDISGVSEVLLLYSTSVDMQWQNITMEPNQTDLWTAIVPGQLNNTVLYVIIIANDTLGNSVETGMIERLVTDSLPISATTPPNRPDEGNKWFAALLMGSGIALIISIIGYIEWNRRYK
jgi:parallel beta-helix repeat protein